MRDFTYSEIQMYTAYIDYLELLAEGN